jgi:hypothetical protein
MIKEVFVGGNKLAVASGALPCRSSRTVRASFQRRASALASATVPGCLDGSTTRPGEAGRLFAPDTSQPAEPASLAYDPFSTLKDVFAGLEPESSPGAPGAAGNFGSTLNNSEPGARPQPTAARAESDDGSAAAVEQFHDAAIEEPTPRRAGPTGDTSAAADRGFPASALRAAFAGETLAVTWKVPNHSTEADITPDTVGDDRYVTLEVRGAKFDDSATFKLIRPTFAEFAPLNYRDADDAGSSAPIPPGSLPATTISTVTRTTTPPISAIRAASPSSAPPPGRTKSSSMSPRRVSRNSGPVPLTAAWWEAPESNASKTSSTS